MTNDKSNGVITEPEDLPDLPAPELPEPLPDLPDLTRLFKNRARNVDVMQKCKHLLIAGYPPGRVALLLRLPLEKVQNLYENSYNKRCRRFVKPNNGKLITTTWNEGATLAEICQALGLPLFTVVHGLRQNGITDAQMALRMPPYDAPLCVEYRQVVARKAVSKFKPIQINPVRRVKKSAGRTATV
ncbi:hypothetical protein [Raoultella ornithinolytica]|uniref:hypothetical protein n=1 Tax=Raoultella ornithinolytica TaxID=54291 RepID=UPI001F425AA6|nr:hypothetical protein [Raoultella ornithinolytica]MCE9801725.1 hypothetical protein [Raoultella ornithinolytica]MCE9810572.1 hypothetical protein [Raoultella ornithinolytica]MCE9866274.1 hypothetical protein [Raoultella ornithinolytica]